MRFRRLIGGFAMACAGAGASGVLAEESQNSGVEIPQALDMGEAVAPEYIADTARVLPRSVAGVLTIAVATAGQDGSFDFLSSVPGVAAFTLTTFGGTASKSMMNVPPGAYTIVQTQNAGGFELQSVRCSGASFSGAAASVSIASGVSSACTFTQATARVGANSAPLEPDVVMPDGLDMSRH